MRTLLLFLVLIVLPVSAYPADIGARVIDGDTIKVPMTAVVGIPPIVSVRFLGVNAPEIHGKCDKEKQLAQAAKAYVTQRLKAAKSVTITFVQWDKYARVDAKVSLDGVDLATDLVKNGYAVAYSGGARDPMFWCKGS